jgi:uncharacterized DUF497 family protein
MPPSFEWDENKSAWNRAERGFGFDIVEIFDWDGAVVEDDGRKDYGERRRRALGYAGGRAVAIVFTERGSRLRIISVRRMHDKEANKYGLRPKEA